MNKITLPFLKGMKGKHDKISMVTCYDASFARLVEKAGIESILVGDSLGMVVKGEENTLNVSVEEVEYHVRAVNGRFEPGGQQRAPRAELASCDNVAVIVVSHIRNP